jgi:RNA polymerase sigma-70 factor (ECF subfamily)
MAPDDAETEALIERIRRGDATAGQQLLLRHRQRLWQMIAVRMDRRLAARFDPSDVVQEALVDAAQKLAEYVERRPLPFYPWLRQLAWERLVKLHQRHLHAQKRSVQREEVHSLALPDESALDLVHRLLAPGTSPSQQLLREELRDRVQAALAQLPERDREVLVLRYLEQLATAEVAAVLGITKAAVKSRHVRALEHLRVLLGEYFVEDQP